MPTCSTSLSGASSDRGLWRATAGRDGTGRINGLSEAPRGTAPHTSAGSDRTREPVGSGGRKANAGEVARSMAARERSSRAKPNGFVIACLERLTELNVLLRRRCAPP